MYYTESMSGGYEELEHTADWALHVFGEDLAELFRNATSGMLELMGVTAAEGNIQERTLELEATDRETLLVLFLEEILFQIETEGLTTTRISFDKIDSHSLSAQLACHPIAGIQKEIKAVTYHNLEIKNSTSGLETVIVFDV